jgi:FixJ family two-component response regulator
LGTIIDQDVEMPSEIRADAKHLVVGVDDDFQVRESIESLLESAGFASLSLSFADEFLQSGSPAKATFLITGVRMPGMNGIELQRPIRLQRPTLPIIFISAHLDEQVRRQAMDAGALDFMCKPFDAVEQLALLHQDCQINLQPRLAVC